ncbi:MAG TPA: hypothetical protein PKV08_06840, partial [Candidatus Syntrophosphaera thermopropionivorans]|nr:hypothetical protein [Candidatus Syntrophosphaera thermopropionivorans]
EDGQKEKKWSIYIYPLIALLLVIGGIFHIEYSFYIFLRVIVFIAAIYLIYLHFKLYKMRSIFIYLFILTALIFNPIIMFKFKKGIWTVIDIIAAIIFILPLFNRSLWES